MDQTVVQHPIQNFEKNEKVEHQEKPESILNDTCTKDKKFDYELQEKKAEFFKAVEKSVNNNPELLQNQLNIYEEEKSI